jgi:hypothetical protein
MFDCNCLIHPFQNDPGTSQRQRVNSLLLSESVKIDGRELADLLDYFVQLSRHINYYDTQMNIADWQPFFQRSTPFVLSSLVRYPVRQLRSNFHIYSSLFKKRPVPNGLQLLSRFIYHHFIEKVNNWHQVLKETHLPISASLDQLIRDRLQQPVRDFIGLANGANSDFDIRPFNFHALFENKVWNIDLPDLYVVNQSYRKGSQDKAVWMSNLYDQFAALFPVFVENLQGLSKVAETSLPLSLVHTKAEYQEKHPPHLGLLFAFLTVFRELQKDLNKFTRKHLDFFYKDILNFKAAPASGDQAHILIEIQQQLKKYILNKGTLVKAGKDEKKQEMLFGMEDEIAANKTQVQDLRTLFLDNKTVFARTYVEGVYIAPNATMADGIEKEFTTDIKNFPTLGAKNSKYANPETKLVKPYPNARIGFILASPVLYLQGGLRKVKIRLACRLNDSLCKLLGESLTSSADCCNPGKTISNDAPFYPPFYKAADFYDDVNNALSKSYYYLSEEILSQALENGVSKEFIESLRLEFGLLKQEAAVCYCPVEKTVFDNFLVRQNICNPLSPEELEILGGLVKATKILNLYFSGAEEWLEPKTSTISMKPVSMNAPGFFTLEIDAVLPPDMEAVTFYDKEKLGEDFNTTLPLVKILLDDRIKFEVILDNIPPDPIGGETECCEQSSDCCVTRPEEINKKRRISFYHFFREVTLDNSNGNSTIHVDVCGLKKFIVQSHESVQDVNAPIYAFGSIPKIDSYFLIGSEEIFLKKWQNLNVNVKWKDLPADLTEYYNGYQSEHRLSNGTLIKKEVVDENNFLVRFSVLRDGIWYEKQGPFLCNNENSDELFPRNQNNFGLCFIDKTAFQKDYSHQYHLIPGNFQGLPASPIEKLTYQGITKYDIAKSRHCFLRLMLKCQDFQHEKYSIVLARQLAAEGKLPNLVDGAVYYGISNTGTFKTIDINKIFDDIILAYAKTPDIRNRLRGLIKGILDKMIANGSANIAIDNQIWLQLFNTLLPGVFLPGNQDEYSESELFKRFVSLQNLLKKNRDLIVDFKAKGVVIPKPPYTPIISNISLDYTAKADINEMDLVHLHAYEGTYQRKQFSLQPTLFPHYCDEGTLFIGLNEFVPGDNLNLLFQLAEATGDSESEKETVNWHYLDSNTWKPLRAGFEVVDDATQNLTTSGVIKFSMPFNMTNENSVMPSGLYWIKASIPKNSKAVSETTGIHPHAVKVIFEPDVLNDTARLANPLAKGSISRLNVADPSISGIDQPYESFGGRLPEDDGYFYTRVSEILRHKGRAIQPWDYERLALEEFPEVFKAKCISHSFALNAHIYKNDFPYAPGYVMLAVIPDLNKLKAGYSFEPKVPVSILEKIEAYFKKRTSPFVRFRAMNPRYEKVHFCIRVQLYPGKDENYYKEKLKQDLREFLAPWAVGKYDKLTFGECVYRSGIIQFLERNNYVDFVTDLRMWKETMPGNKEVSSICPDTARSILIAGDIEVCIEEIKCEKPGPYTGCQDVVIDKCNNPAIPVMEYCK